jgi:flagellar hook-length control protein FliK
MKVTADLMLLLPGAGGSTPADEGLAGASGTPDFGVLVAALLGQASAAGEEVPTDDDAVLSEDVPDEPTADLGVALGPPGAYAVPTTLVLPAPPAPLTGTPAGTASPIAPAPAERPAVPSALPPPTGPTQPTEPVAPTEPARAEPPLPVATRAGTPSAPAPTDPPAPGLPQVDARTTQPQTERVDQPTQVTWAATGSGGGQPAEGPRTEVGRQLAPVLARIMTVAESGAPTTHRVTLRLHPEVLGEVRVALTVRGGELHVTLSAGESARDLLRRDSGLLHHLLGQGGAERVEVTFRALPGSERRDPFPAVTDQGFSATDPGSGGTTGRDPRDNRPDLMDGGGRHPWREPGGGAPVDRPGATGATPTRPTAPVDRIRSDTGATGLDITV